MKFKRNSIFTVTLVSSLVFFSGQIMGHVTSPPHSHPHYNPVPVLGLLLLGEDFVVEDDTLNVTAGSVSTSLNVLSNDTIPSNAMLLSIGGPAESNSSDNVVGSIFSLASGAQVTLAADGQLSYDATGLTVTTPGTDVLFYVVEEGAIQETGKITVNYGDAPIAQDDPDYQTFFVGPIIVSSNDGLLSNDALGAPDAVVASFGGGDLGGNINSNIAGASAVFMAAGGDLQVNADGSFDLSGEPFTDGVFTFDYRIKNIHGQSDATVTLTIDPHPVAVNDTLRISEDAVVTSIDVLANDTDINNLSSIDSVTAAANGTVVITNSGSDLSYEPNADYCNDGTPTDDFTYTLAPGGSTATVAVTVDCVNDEPSFTVGADETVLEDAGVQSVSNWASALSAGPANESGQTLSFDISTDNDVLFSNLPAVSSAGTLSYTPQDDANGSAVVTLAIMDDGGTANGGDDISDTQNFTINVTSVADEPEITSNGGGDTAAIDVDENTIAVTDVDASDAEGDTENGGGLSYGISGADAGKFDIDPAGLLSFKVAPDFENPTDVGMDGVYDVTVTVTDTEALTDSQDIAITVANVAGGNITILKNVVGSGFADMDFSFMFDGSTPFAISENDNSGFTQIDIPPGTYNVTETVPTAWNLSSIDCGLNQNNTPAVDGVNIVLENNENVICTFNNTPMDGNITIIVDTLPEDAQDFAFTSTGGLAPAMFSLDDDADGTLPDMQLFADVAPGSYAVTQTAVAGYDITMMCVDPTADSSTAVATVNIELAPGEAVACTFTNTSSPPIAVDDSYTATGNIGISISDGADDVLERGTDDTVNGASIVTFGPNGDETSVGVAGSTAQGGTVTLNSDGSFVYEPAAGYTGSDTFKYTLTNAGGSSVATVTIAVSNVIWFIDNSGAGNNSGTFSNPFLALSAFNASMGPSAGDFISLSSGSYNEADGINLKNNQSLLGRGVAISSHFSADANSPMAYTVFAAAPSTRPTISTSGGAGNNAIDLAASNTIRGLNIGNRPNALAIRDNGANAGTVTISNMFILGLGGGIEIDNGGVLAISLDGLTATGSTTDEGIHLANVSGDFDVGTLAASTISTTGIPAIVIDGNPTLDLGVTLTSVSSSGGTNNGISVQDTSGSLIISGAGTASSGGTIATKTGANGSATSGIGIYLNNASNVAINDMQLNDFSNFAILGSNVTGLTLADTIINGTNGDAAASDEAAVQLNGVSGNLVVSNGSYSGGHENTFGINNASGTVTANFSGVTIGANQAATGAHGLHFVTSGTAEANININSSTINGSRRAMILVEMGGSAGGTVNIGNAGGNSLTLNQIQDAAALDDAIHVELDGVGNVSTNISNNTLAKGSFTFEGDGIAVQNLSTYTGTHRATISGNIIGMVGVNGSAFNPLDNQGDAGIEVVAQGAGTMIALVDNNSVFDYNASGIEALFNGTGSYDLTITNNTVSDAMGSSGFDAAIAAFGGGSSATVNTCIQIDGNNLNDPTNEEVDVDVIAAPYRDPGLLTLTNPGLQSHLLATNTGTSPYTTSVFTDGVAGGGACVQP